jgi:hypothetical protein
MDVKYFWMFNCTAAEASVALCSCMDVKYFWMFNCTAAEASVALCSCKYLLTLRAALMTTYPYDMI